MTVSGTGGGALFSFIYIYIYIYTYIYTPGTICYETPPIMMDNYLLEAC